MKKTMMIAILTVNAFMATANAMNTTCKSDFAKNKVMLESLYNEGRYTEGFEISGDLANSVGDLSASPELSPRQAKVCSDIAVEYRLFQFKFYRKKYSVPSGN